MNLEHIKPKDFKPIAIKNYCRFHDLVIFIFLAVFTIPAFAYGVTSDDFNTCVINQSLWTLVDPLGDASISIVGAGTGDAQLYFSVPDGLSHDPWRVDTAPRLLQAISNADFEVEVKFDSVLSMRYQEQGIIIEENSDHWLRFDFHHNGSSVHIFAASMLNGSPSVKVNQSIDSGTPMYMRVERSGNNWIQSYSFDGTVWTVAVSFTHDMIVNETGPFVGNFDSSGNAPAHTAVIDYFFNVSYPIEPEDGGTVPTETTLDVTVTGSGTVGVDPDQTTYGCGELVTLTAIPDAGYEFTGWNGDLGGSDNPATLTMNSDKSVTATFVPDTSPPVISNVQVTTGQSIATITWTTDEQATSVVAYGETTVYELGTEEDLTFKIDHSITLTNLNPATLYHYKITSEDSYGNANTTADQTFVTDSDPGPDPSGIVSDDFNTCSLDTGLWNLIDPLGDAVVSIVGAGTGDAQLFFSVPAGVSHDAWTVNTAPRLLQPVNNTDFVVEVKYDSTVDEIYQGQGIIIEESSANWLRFDFYSDGSSTFIYAASFVDGSPSTKANQTITLGSPVYMQVQRSGNDWTLSYSNDGLTWTEVVTFQHLMAVSALGPFVGNDGDSGAPAHTAMIDYFFNALDPIEPEDGGTVPTECTLDVTVTGSGTVGVDPDQTTYGCGELVTLTAIPDAGYEFTGWSGDLGGSENPATITMNFDKSVTANFDIDATPPVISNVQVTTGQSIATITWTTDEPATSIVAYGETTGYELGTEDDLTFKIDHSITLTNLNPETLYHYKITSEDSYGNANTTSDQTFVTNPDTGPGPSGIVSDDFNTCSLDIGLWDLIDPLGDAVVSIVGAGTGDAQLLFSIPAGVSHDAWTVNTAPRLLQSVNNTDFVVEVKYDSTVDERYQSQGIIIEESSANWLRFDFYSDGSSTFIFAASFVDGSSSIKANQTITLGSPAYMQVERSGHDWTLSYSNDGLTWTEAVTFTHTMAVSALGPFVGNDGTSGNAPAHTAMIDYFFNALDPIEPEDGGTVPTETTLDVTVTGSGTVGVDPDQTTYGCGELVILTAIPDAGYEFTGWNGDLGGSDNPATLTMNSDKSVTATFVPDTSPPVIGNINENAGHTSATITWTTDEPATSVVEYGETTSYELGMVEDVNLKLSHFIGLTGLISGVEYHYRITSEDALGFLSTTVDRTFITSDASSGAPLIQVWYGSEQTFGSLGNPQRWVNILGNVSDPDGVSVLKYSLNGGSELPLTIGSGYYRLANTGDFNVEIALTDLQDGVNQVIVTARDSLGNETAEVVVLNYASGNVWPESYTIDWSNVSSIQDVAQVVDGLWQIEDGNVRVVEPGYDRIIAIGDIAWTNYEVIVPVTAHNLDFSGNPPALGLLVRWQGHVADGNQPSMQWWPLGVFAHCRWPDEVTTPSLRLWAAYPNFYVDSKYFEFAIGVKYIFKLRSETVSGDTTYSFKVWRADDSEPPEWSLVGEEPTDDQTEGSLILVAHNVEASFGNVSITPLGQEQYVLAVNAAGNGIVEKSPDQPTYTFGETITLTATADPGWLFTGWSGDLSGTDNPASILMFGDRNISANFSEITQHTLSVTTDGNGSVTVEPDLPIYNLGQQVTLTATADPDWVFTGWSGDLSGVTSPVTLTISGDHQITATFVEGALAYSEGFEAYNDGDDPVDWLDTGASNSMVEDNSLFQVFDLGDEKVFGTISTKSDIHTHYIGPGSSTFSAYEYTGRMMMTASNGGIGVTFFSQYPYSDAYYRLRRYSSNSFHIAPHGTSITGGTTDTGVVPAANDWYRFRIWVQDTGTRTEIRAKVWPDGGAEPANWQVDAYDDNITRLTSGTFGVWSYSSGGKYWDDLMVNLIAASQEELSLSVTTSGNGSVDVVPNQAAYSFGQQITLTAMADPGWVLSVWSGDLTGNDNPATIVMTGNQNITATFSEITQHTLDVTTVGNGSVVVDPEQLEYDLGQQVTLTAVADLEWVFTGWSGDLSGVTNPVTLTISGDHQITATFADSELLAYAEDFETYFDGEDPVDWLDTAANNSMSEDNSLFQVVGVGGEKVFGTASTLTNIHSHYMGSGTVFSDYEYTGRMMMTASSGGIGVTFLSQYPVTDAYYRLRRYSSNSFHIAPHGASVFGITDTGVVPIANNWYRFRVRVQDTGIRTEILAKVWLDGDVEPIDWQVDAYDDTVNRLVSGTFGVWSYSSGSKYWDDLMVIPFSPQ